MRDVFRPAPETPPACWRVQGPAWAAGCNLRCPQCQNYATTYDGVGGAVTPQEAALLVTRARGRYGVDRMAVSGGEATLNCPWLVGYFQALKALNPDPPRLGLLYLNPYAKELMLRNFNRGATSCFALP